MNLKLQTLSCLVLIAGLVAMMAGALASCGSAGKVQARNPGDASSATDVSVGVVKVGRKNLGRTLTLSSELVPFQEIDVYAKESGYVKELKVDYGTRVEANQSLATLEIPELQSQLKQDDAAIKNASDQIMHAENELSRMEATHTALQLMYDRYAKVKSGLLAQQEIDDAQAKALS